MWDSADLSSTDPGPHRVDLALILWWESWGGAGDLGSPSPGASALPGREGGLKTGHPPAGAAPPRPPVLRGRCRETLRPLLLLFF